MRTAAIICEFDPFHEGHKYLIENVRRDIDPDALVCIMSGNYVQRGKPSVFDKRQRAFCAIKGGADLVLQMPVCVSLSSAKYFAKGAVDIAKAMKIDHLCFGSESGDLDELKTMATEGIDGIEEGNNILAAEYLRNLDESIAPYTVKIDESLGHASDIRKNLGVSYDEEVFKLLQYKIISSTAEELRKAPEVSEGIENRILSVISKAYSLDDLILRIKSKRYNYARISRMLMQILLSITSSTPNSPYAHVLAFNKTGQKFLSHIKKNEGPALYSNLDPEMVSRDPFLLLDVKADDIYSIIKERTIYDHSDYVCKPNKTNV